MKKWQILEFDGKPYYAFVPENEEPLDLNKIPTIDEDENSNEPQHLSLDRQSRKRDIKTEPDCIFEESLDNDESFYDYDYIENDIEEDENVNTILLNGIDEENKNATKGDLYQVKIEGSLITLEKLIENVEVKEKTEESILPDNENQQELELQQELIENEREEEDVKMEEEHPIQKVYNYGEREVIETEIIDFVTANVDEQGEEEDEDEEDVDDVHEVSQDTLSSTVLPEQSQTRTRYRTILPNPSTALKCKACSETFGSAIAFRKHVAWTHKKKVCIQENGAYICAVCDFRTLKKNLFAAHLERKHETWPRKGQSNVIFPCKVCGFECRSKHSLQSHFIRKHTDKFEHQCKFCPKKFKVKGDLTNHVRFHHKEKPINCDVCGKLCQNTGSLYVHQKWAHYKPKFECPICKRRMVTQENLDQHMVTQHEKREKIVCAQCGKTFTKKDSFKRHMAVHTGSKPHSCPICTKPFARQSQLRQHVLIHTGKRPFVCDICGKAFTQKPGLICHRKTHPGPHPPLPVMPIADLVKQFTEGYLQETGNMHDDDEDEEEEEEEDEAEVEGDGEGEGEEGEVVEELSD